MNNTMIDRLAKNKVTVIRQLPPVRIGGPKLSLVCDSNGRRQIVFSSMLARA